MKKVTMSDIAKKAGVSKATVSMVINGRDSSISKETRTRILKIVKELNYIPNSVARSLNTNKSGTIGIILPDITNPFFSSISRAIEDEASLLGYNVIFCNTDSEIEKEEKYTKLLISKLVDGVIFTSGGEGSNSIKMLKDNNIPFVLVDRYIKIYEDSYGVYCSNKDGIIKGIEYLYSKGKRRIAFVKGVDDLEISNQRLEGYTEITKKYNIYDKNLIFEGDFTIESGITATKMMVKQKSDIDAIFYSNDLMALGGMKVLLRNGYKVPEDISVMGFDNIDISSIIEPELTTIGQPIYDMGKKSCKLLIDVINGVEIKDKEIFFETELIVRGTT